MNQREAKDYGIDQGYNAAIYTEVREYDKHGAGCECDPNNDDKVCEECLSLAAFESEQNARQYSPFEIFASEINELGDRSEGLWNVYEEGVEIGIKRGIKERLS